ncbi:ribonuclease Y [Dethiosulfovibrio salsuginis]|uniref:Ribonuclease Y n=1 Tax=Dethiosulfovibrio salsuginis TaxID=561720 RepID=A0A1X7J1L7_9BACT|nr:ribonuclease Y [Dethiosulfovibrio salsuginis]SMG21051.1 metal dependent phosphohydrolase [Dethiosulfovibrio salsuginis]
MESTVILGVVAGLAFGVAGGLLISRSLGGKHLLSAQKQADQIVKKAVKDGEQRKRETLSEVREEVFQMRQEAEKEAKDRRSELQRAERRLEQKEENLDKKLDRVSRREDDLKSKLDGAEKKLQEADKIKQEQVEKLEEIAQLTRDQAKDILMKEVEDKAQHSLGMLIKDLEEKARWEAARKAREIIVTAIQRCAVEHSSDVAVSVVNLPSDEMKGRIIGREGRNIRAFETETGVDLIVDDTPEAVTLSCFDPVRREIARISLERLVNDGRIHPARIEELIQKATEEVEESIMEAGEQCLLDLGIKHMHVDLIRLVGSLKYRYSYGQNGLQHSMEVAHISGIIAAELGADEDLAKRAGLLHDIGKAVDHKIEGPHALIGADLAKRYNEPPEIINAIGAHHEDMEIQSVYDVIVASADAISAARPGARRESLDAYVKRLEKLETLAKSFKDVSKAYAIQAGREVRVMVAPNISDEGVINKLAFDVAKKIEEEMKYPGQIKVTAIKEFRAVEYAK